MATAARTTTQASGPDETSADGARADLDAFLRRYAGRTVYLVQNPGNAGDSVIGAAGYQRLDRAGVRVVEPSWKGFDPAGKIVFYPGGGNLIHEGTHSHRLLSAWHARAAELVILPHTLTGVDSLLASFGANVTVVCREAVSYAYARGARGRHRTLLSDDLAFGLDVSALMARRLGWVPLAMGPHYAWSKLTNTAAHPGLGQVLGAWRAAARLHEVRTQGGPVLRCFRTDGESRGGRLPEGNADISRLFAFGTTPRPVCEWVAQLFVRAMEPFEEIHTDRLHVGITAALLGKRVRLSPNNYFKVRAIWEFSMRGRFPNVEWAER